MREIMINMLKAPGGDIIAWGLFLTLMYSAILILYKWVRKVRRQQKSHYIDSLDWLKHYKKL